jgi:hypothetical protein
MRPLSLLALLLVGVLSLSSLGAAENEKRPDVADFPFWTGKKRGYVSQFMPGLTAVLQLSEAQKQAIAIAREEWSSDEGLKAARSISKSDPSVTAEQREKARAAIDGATVRLHGRVDAILAPEQKALIDKINSAYAQAVEDVGIVYQDKFGSVKADEAARRRIQEEKNQDTEEQFLHKLDGILTASQKEAMTRAAEMEEQRDAKAAGIKKPSK